MFVGLYSPRKISSALDSLRDTGTTLGDLGRHTEIGSDGSPVITRRLEVFQQAGSLLNLLSVTYLMAMSRSTMLL